MSDFLNFVQQHWEMILSIFLSLLSVLFYILKKRPIWNKVSTIYQAILEKLPVFIQIVEKEGHGSEKLMTVLGLVKTYLQEAYKFNNFDEIRPWVVNAIESILSTPQKKEV